MCSYQGEHNITARLVNFYADPFAVHEVLASKCLPLERVFVLPLDLTGNHVLPFSEYKGHVDPALENTRNPSQMEGKSPLVHFTSSMLEMTREVHITNFPIPRSALSLYHSR